jgi:hypothetical protein
MGNRQQSQEASTSPFPYEVLTTTELAERLKVKESWVVDQSKRSRTSDPIPIFRLGKHRRYLWGSPELNAWLISPERFVTGERVESGRRWMRSRSANRRGDRIGF